MSCLEKYSTDKVQTEFRRDAIINRHYILMSAKRISLSNITLVGLVILGAHIGGNLHAETVTGGGYRLEQIITPIEGAISGNGFTVQQSAQALVIDGGGGGYTIASVYGTSSATSSTPITPPSGGGGSVIYGGSYFIYPTATGTQGTSTSIIINGSSTNPTVIDTGSTCKSRITFTGPIDVGSVNNLTDDVKKLEIFLNTYENEKLPVNGIYEARDILAVKRWQKKYKTFILDPMLLKEPTGTIYTLSQRQIERQTTKPCGLPVTVTACPYFKEYASYGDRGPDVKKIQQFLNVVRGERLPLSGVYGPRTKAATKRFQQAYRKDIFNILRLSFISGNWNEATRVKANQAIGCDIIK